MVSKFAVIFMGLEHCWKRNYVLALRNIEHLLLSYTLVTTVHTSEDNTQNHAQIKQNVPAISEPRFQTTAEFSTVQRGSSSLSSSQTKKTKKKKQEKNIFEMVSDCYFLISQAGIVSVYKRSNS